MCVIVIVRGRTKHQVNGCRMWYVGNTRVGEPARYRLAVCPVFRIISATPRRMPFFCYSFTKPILQSTGYTTLSHLQRDREVTVLVRKFSVSITKTKNSFGIIRLHKSEHTYIW